MPNVHPEYIFDVMNMSEDEFINLQKKLLEISVYVKLIESNLEECDEINEKHDFDDYIDEWLCRLGWCDFPSPGKK